MAQGVSNGPRKSASVVEERASPEVDWNAGNAVGPVSSNLLLTKHVTAAMGRVSFLTTVDVAVGRGAGIWIDRASVSFLNAGKNSCSFQGKGKSLVGNSQPEAFS